MWKMLGVVAKRIVALAQKSPLAEL